MTKEHVMKTIFTNLKPIQQVMFKHFFGSDKRKQVMHCSRRLGKTYLLCAIASVVAVSGPNKQIRLATFTNKSLKKMVLPLMRQIWQAMPLADRPVFTIADSVFTFKNGSQLHLAGVNNGRSDDLRGTSADLCLVDEAAFVEELGYLIESVLMPQLITSPNGKLLLASSSPLSPAHEFVEYINSAKLSNSYQSYDIYEGGYEAKTIVEFCNEAGGAKSTTWRREYLNEIVTDSEMAIIPEWDSKLYAQSFLPDKQYDKYYHKYESMDLGVRDKTAVLLAHYRFNEGRLYVEAEWTCSGQDSVTRNIASNVRRLESEYHYETVYKRVSDNNALITLQDLSNEFGLYFGATSKDTLAAMVNEVRLWVAAGRLIVHKRCIELISCLEFGVYKDEKRDMFGRSKSLGHYDLLASLVYLIRNIDQHTNPIPVNHNYTANTFNPNLEADQDAHNTDIKRIFNIK